MSYMRCYRCGADATRLLLRMDPAAGACEAHGEPEGHVDWRALVGEIVLLATPSLPQWEVVAAQPQATDTGLARRWLAAIHQAEAALDGTTE